MTTFNLEQYLEHVKVPRPTDNSVESLNALIFAHLQTFPFDTFSAYTGEMVKIGVDDIWDKFYRRSRGGYCFEHNTLFNRVLRELGWDATTYCGRVYWTMESSEISAPPVITHLLNVVTIDGVRYLVDVGYGNMAPSTALLLDDPSPQASRADKYRLQPAQESEIDPYVLHKVQFLLQCEIKGQWRALYGIVEPIIPEDCEAGNWYASTHPDAMFTQVLTAAILEGTTRRTLKNITVQSHTPDAPSEKKELQSADELAHALHDVFGIDPNNIIVPVDQLFERARDQHNKKRSAQS